MGDLRSELLEIRERRGLLTPPIVVEEATDPDHPLHSRFEWDDGEAAHRWRLQQASNLLRISFRYQTNTGHSLNVRHFWIQKGTPENPESQYVPVEEVAMNPVAKTVMLQQMRRDWQRFRARYEGYSEFMDLLATEMGLDGEPGNGTEG